MTDVDQVAVQGDITSRLWYHTIELPDGVVTPGWYDTRAIARHVPWPERLVGGRCLDVGTFDGFWAFEMERRGAAEVVAVDLDDPTRLDWTFDQRPTGPDVIAQWGTERGPGFASAAAALGSGVIRKDRSVYDLSPEDIGQFDVVFCGALLLHLRDPVLALERMRSVCRGVLVVAESIDPRLELVAPTMPVAYLHPTTDEWWVVNSRGLMQMVEMAGFRVLDSGRRFLVGYGPGGPDNRTLPLMGGLAARQPGRRGHLQRVLVAEPRSPDGTR
jgi:tRNA (mo5U34)-methyltransferase